MKLATTLELAHINIRREKEGEDDGPVATDLKFVGSVPVDALEGLFSTPTGFDFALGSLYRDDGELVTHDVASMTLAREGLGVALNIHAGLNTSIVFEGADVNRIRLSPQPGRVVDVALRVQCRPNNGDLVKLAEFLGATVELNLQASQTELDLSSDAKA
jgi:hypothetical protein